MPRRAAVGSERVLVTGASGGVGLAAVQLAERRGATVIAVCSPSKATDVMGQGADQTVDRGADLVSALGRASVDVVIDLVGGAQFSQLLDILRRGGRYAISGAIGGPIAEIDLRMLYLRDLSLFGCTLREDEVFEDLIDYVERGEVRPVVARTYPWRRSPRRRRTSWRRSTAGSWCSSHPVRLLDQAPHVRRSAHRGQRTGGRGIHGAFGRGGWRGPTCDRRRTRGPRCGRAAGCSQRRRVAPVDSQAGGRRVIGASGVRAPATEPLWRCHQKDATGGPKRLASGATPRPGPRGRLM